MVKARVIPCLDVHDGLGGQGFTLAPPVGDARAVAQAPLTESQERGGNRAGGPVRLALAVGPTTSVSDSPASKSTRTGRCEGPNNLARGKFPPSTGTLDCPLVRE